MGQDSKIEWTHHTFNPWWGCVKVSPGCVHCYAETFAKRTGNAVWGTESPRRFFGEKHWNEPRKWNATAQSEGQRKRVFCASMADVFEDREDLRDERQKLLHLIDETPWLDWLLLTKRPQNIARLMDDAMNGNFDRLRTFRDHMPNVWLGTTAEDQERYDERMPWLLQIESTVRFVSAEPLLGPIVMNGAPRPDWIIVGGESGGKARPMERAWVESLRDQCDERTAFFFKQWGGVDKKSTGRDLDGRTWDALPSANARMTCAPTQDFQQPEK
jgi:protein gp37